jgi:hypothetical protein
MRKSLWIIPLLFAAVMATCALRAKADETSTFAGTVTQAPSGNAFGVVLNDFVEGDVGYPVVLGSNYNGTVNNFTIVFDIGSAIYTEVAAPTGNPGSITLSDGLITDIDVTYPPSPCTPDGPSCPALTLIGATFFTSPTDCETGQVCGTLDFANSQPVPTPEPSSLALILIGAGFLFFVIRKRIADGLRLTGTY